MNSIQKTNFLKEWFSQSEGYIEFRLIGQAGLEDQRFVAVEDLNDPLLASLIEKGQQEDLNVYFGVATRKSKPGTEENVYNVPGLWVDIDPKHATYEKAMQVVTQLPTPPSYTISSGNGIHAYFRFNEPFVVNDAKDLKFIKELSTKLHIYTNADHTHDLSRMLRVPNSLNVKDLENIQMCSVIESTNATYSLDSFSYLKDVEIIAKANELEKVKIADFSSINLDELNINSYMKKLIIEGVSKGERSEKIFGVVCSLLEAKHTPEEIAFVLTNPDWAISDKILERPAQHQLSYIENAINNANSRIQGEETNQPVESNCAIYVSNNCYYEKDKRLSNFIFVPEERVILSTDEYLKGYVLLQNGEKLSDIVLSAKGLSSKKNFIEELSSTKISWLGTDKHVQYLKELFLNSTIIEKHGVNKIGLHKDVFVTPHVVISSDGIVENSNLMYISKLIHSPMDLERTIKMPITNDWKIITKQILPLLSSINEESVIGSIIGWHFVAPIAPLIREVTDNSFPQLMIWGSQSAGKTSTAQVFGKLFGNPEIHTCTRPTFSIMREVDLLSGVPLYLDEFRPYNMVADHWKGLKNLALNAYKAAFDVRGTQNQSTLTYQYTAPIVWLGETSFEESNMLERLIITQLRPNLLEEKYKLAYIELNKLSLQSFVGGYIQWTLNKLQNKEVNLKHLYDTYKEMLRTNYELHERPMSNVAIVLTGVHLFNMLANELNLDCSISTEKVTTSQVAYFGGNKIHSALQSLFKFTAAIVQTDSIRLRKGVHYEYNPAQKKLTIAKDVWFPEIRKYIKDHDYTDERISDRQLENLLKENQLHGGFVLHASEPRNVGGKSTRSYVINTELLEEVLDISSEIWE